MVGPEFKLRSFVSRSNVLSIIPHGCPCTVISGPQTVIDVHSRAVHDHSIYISLANHSISYLKTHAINSCLNLVDEKTFSIDKFKCFLLPEAQCFITSTSLFFLLPGNLIEPNLRPNFGYEIASSTK